MKTVVILAALVAVIAALDIDLSVEIDDIERQQKVLSLLENIQQESTDADWWQIGSEYDVEANINSYTDEKAVEEFLHYYNSGFMPKDETFSMFNDRMREEAIALFKLLYYAHDFDTFVNTAAFVRVHFNDGQFLYAYYIAIYQRPDTNTLVLPSPHEMLPQYFVDTKTLLKAYRVKMQNGNDGQEGVNNQNGQFIFYANYTSPWLTGNEEDKLSYFTEDIGMNSYYYYFQISFPFWWSGNSLEQFDEYQSDLFYFTYQQLVAKYYLNRLSSGLGEIPEFSWIAPIKPGHYSSLSTNNPFFSRNENYQINKVENAMNIQYLNNYEQSFLSYIEQGNSEILQNKKLINLRNSPVDLVNEYWFTNYELAENLPQNQKRSYGIVGLHLLAGTPDPLDKRIAIPSDLELYQTSLRDPVFYQFYARTLNYIFQWKRENLEPYSSSDLNLEGVQISDVQIDELVTFFELYDFNISNAIYYSAEEFNANDRTNFTVRQPRLNHKVFMLRVSVQSDVATSALVKLFLGPKYDSNGFHLSIEDNWKNFVELDWFMINLTLGQNEIERSSQDFSLYRKDTDAVAELLKMSKQGKVPFDMSETLYQPERMMLPKGTKGGFPFQIYVVVYPQTSLPLELTKYSLLLPDTKPLSYPFDRPVREASFKQPNIYNKDVFIYHEGDDNPNIYNI